MASSRKPAAVTEHFALSWRRAQLMVAPEKPLRAPVFMMAVGKKLLPRAVDRNRVKRIAREAWRARLVAQPQLARTLSVSVRLARRPAMLATVCDAQKKRLLRDELDRLLAQLPPVKLPAATASPAGGVSAAPVAQPVAEPVVAAPGAGLSGRAVPGVAVPGRQP